VRGVKDFAMIDDALLGSAEARKLDEYAASCRTPIRARQHAAAQGQKRRSMAPSACSRR
jgi:hypothetical protein